MLQNYLRLAGPILKNRIRPSLTPFFCTYSVTWQCNARCTMCGIWKKTPAEEMDIPKIERVFKQLPYLTSIRITGGEPFLRPDLTEIVDAVRRRTRIQTLLITSNGILTDRILKFVESQRGGNIRLKISLNGCRDAHDARSGRPGAFRHAVETLEALVPLRRSHGLYLGINHTIADRQSYLDSKEIRALCRKYRLSYLPVLAYGEVPLYGSAEGPRVKDPQSEESIPVTRQELKSILEDLLRGAGKIDGVFEKFFKTYYLKGLYNRFVLNKKTPNPGCVVLKNHIRILPDGRVAVCLYNSETLGNLAEEDFARVWHGPKASRLREWVGGCKGCWLQCDIFPNFVYSGTSRTDGPFFRLPS